MVCVHIPVRGGSRIFKWMGAKDSELEADPGFLNGWAQKILSSRRKVVNGRGPGSWNL